MNENKSSISQAQSYEEMGEFWDNHDLGDYWEETYPVKFEIAPLTNLLHPKLIILSSKLAHCPRCQQNLNVAIINYITWWQEKIQIIQDVPIFRCQDNNHEYILEKTLDQLEQLLNLEELKPVEIVETPVFSLKMAA